MKATPVQAGYQGPDQGPFACGNCSHFDPQQSACELVDGHIDAQGCCNLFNKGSAGGQQAVQQAAAPPPAPGPPAPMAPGPMIPPPRMGAPIGMRRP